MTTNRDMCEAITRKLLAKLGTDLDMLKAAGLGVTIFAFTFEPGAMAYISTAERSDMIRLVKEWLAYVESGMATEPAGERGSS